MNDTLCKIEKNIFLEQSIKEITKKISSGEITPLDIARECIERIDMYNGKYKVWVCYDKEILFNQAMKISERLNEGGKIRALEGIPAGIPSNALIFPPSFSLSEIFIACLKRISLS